MQGKRKPRLPLRLDALFGNVRLLSSELGRWWEMEPNRQLANRPMSLAASCSAPKSSQSSRLSNQQILDIALVDNRPPYSNNNPDLGETLALR